MLSCKETTRLISESFERRLSLRERLGVRMHLLVCRFCLRYRRQVQFIEDAMRHLRGSEEEDGVLEFLLAPALSGEAMARIRSSIKERMQ